MGIYGSELKFQRLRGEEIQREVEGLAQLRIDVFAEFPYLYEGQVDYEKEYLRTYIKCPDAFLFAVYDGDRMVGATTCLPLLAETPEVQGPFLEKGMDLGTIVYFGESILQSSYRGRGLGKMFFQEREAHAKSLAGISEVYFCAVRRPEDHALRPKDYKPLDPFWRSQGYQKKEGLVSYFSWKDRGMPKEDVKPMDYWFKEV